MIGNKMRNYYSNELQMRCNGLKNPNHVLEVALQLQKEIFDKFESYKPCDGYLKENEKLHPYRHEYADVLHKWLEDTTLEVEMYSRLGKCNIINVNNIITFNDDIRIKPRTIHEYQWLKDGVVQDLGFYAEKELKDYADYCYEKIENTKRVRK